MMNEKQQLLEIYRQNPCRTLPNVLWKTIDQKDSLQIDIRRGHDDALTTLAVWQDSRLMAFWCEDPMEHPLSPEQVFNVPFALVHSRALPIFEHHQFSRQEAYFRIIHKGTPSIYCCPPGFEYRNVYPQTEIDLIVKFVQSGYGNMKVNESIVREWLAHSVYEMPLWIWIIDSATKEPVGLGIAELDRKVPEASLEWIQVLPTFQGLGLGKAIVAELLRRVSGIVDFTTVVGRIKNPTRPEKLFRRCGFLGRDLWWLLIT